MRTLVSTLLPAFLVLFLFAFCTKEFIIPENRSAVGKKNGEPWEALCTVLVLKDENPRGRICFQWPGQKKSLSESMCFHDISVDWPQNNPVYFFSNEVESPPLDDTLSAWYSIGTFAGDCAWIVKRYKVDNSPDKENKLVIESIEGNEINGKFDICFNLPGTTETVTFEDVRFNSIIDYR